MPVCQLYWSFIISTFYLEKNGSTKTVKLFLLTVKLLLDATQPMISRISLSIDSPFSRRVQIARQCTHVLAPNISIFGNTNVCAFSYLLLSFP